MNFSTVLSILTKDFKRLVWFALPASIAAYGDRFMVFASMLEGASAQMATLLQWPLVFFVALALGAEDRAVGDNTFWRTRPISSSEMMTAKILGLLLLLVVPIVLIELIRALQHDVSSLVAVAMMLERAGTVALISLIGLLLGSLTDSLLRAMAVIVVSVAVIMLAVILGFNAWIQFLFGGFRLPEISTASRITVGVVLLIGSLGSLLAVAYRYNSVRLTTAGIVMAIVASTSIANAWKWQLVAEPSSPTQIVNYGEETEFTVSHFRELEVMSTRGLGNTQTDLGLSLHYVWNTPELAVKNLRKESKITLPDGSVFQRKSVGGSMLSYYSFHQMLRHQIGLPTDSGFWANRLKLMSEGRMTGRENIVTLPTKALEEFQQQIADVETRFVLDLAEPKTLSIMAPQAGEIQANDGEIFQTRAPQTLDNGSVTIPILNSRATSMLYPRGIHRPDRQISGRFYGFALVNRSRNEASISTRFGKIFVMHQGAFPTRLMSPRFPAAESLDGPNDNNEPSPIDQDWLDGAELMIVVAQHVGETSRTVVFENLKIPGPQYQRAKEQKSVFIQ